MGYSFGLHFDETIEETADFLLNGEKHPSIVAKDTLPVRYLDEFIIRDENTGKMISLDEIESDMSDSSPYFVGWVSPKLEEPPSAAEAVELERVFIRSSSIFSIWQSQEPEENQMVYEESWYILDKPDPSYRALFKQPYLRHAIFLSVVHQASRYKDTTLERFFGNVRKNEIKWAREDLGEPFVTEEDVKRVIPDVLHHAFQLDPNEEPEIHEHYAPELLYRLRTSPDLSNYMTEDKNSTSGSEESMRASRIPQSRTSRYPSEVISSRGQLSPTFCTPFIQRLAGHYFPSLRVRQEAGEISEGDEVNELLRTADNAEDDWMLDTSPPELNSILWDQSRSISWLEISGERFELGDVVFIRPDPDLEGNKINPRITFEDVHIQIEIGKIIRFSLDHSQHVQVHVLWFISARNSSLDCSEEIPGQSFKPISHPQELVLIDDCENVPASRIIGHCHAQYLDIESAEPAPSPRARSFFYRYFWNQENDDAYLDASVFLDQFSETNVDNDNACSSCRSSTRVELKSRTRETEDGVSVGDVEYHLHDFVYLQNKSPNLPYIIGQITGIDLETVSIARMYRIQRPFNNSHYHNDRLLNPPVRTSATYNTQELQGKCFIVNPNPDDFRLPDDHFACSLPSSHPRCTRCRNNALIQSGVLHCLDLFSGAGGLSLGLEASGAVQTKWAVEYDSSSAATFQQAHPDAIMFNTCINKLLSGVQQRDDAGELDRNSPQLDQFPKPGEVDIIVGGPPCRPSSAYLRRLGKRPRSPDIQTWRNPNKSLYVGRRYTERGHHSGQAPTHGNEVCRFLTNVSYLMLIGSYQVRYGVLNAGQHGVPQIRRRVFVIAAKRGNLLPDLPQPTHVAMHATHNTVTVEEGKVYTVSRRRENNAPLYAVTVGDAITDLPQWEWVNPHKLYKRTTRVKQEELERRWKHGILAIDVKSQPISTSLPVCGPDSPLQYPLPALTNYQLLMRERSTTVTQHWTPALNELEIERVCNIPFKSKRGDRVVPDHHGGIFLLDLPSRLRRPGWADRQQLDGRYGRLDAEDVFATSLHRILTIREAARSQGFPDHIDFRHEDNNVKLITQQIGNAVPVPLAAAVGREIAKARRALAEGREGSVEL
ncbi:hypothetical protein PIIN_02281 [Serendipita indica DSM 11827]|uniref:DNA (cytosine-5-)-methyltransferase n=1 Tax=Serendipita indica (strain DSM 11827) TaxID=1109443 RepID=G4TAT8_SERID|nr:hypothetical protein PIIN_02281 [Serendipita indica DSM 11827]